MIAVALLTCDRFDYTERTLRSFAAHNDRSRFRLLHADDASTDTRVPALAHTYGFQTVAQSTVRRGWLAMRLALFQAAEAARDVEWILLLENDIEWLRPFPWALFDYVRKLPNIYCLRLYGEFKDAARTERCLDTHKRYGHRRVKWRTLKYAPEPTQVGLIHWSAQPSVTRTAPLLEQHRYGMESPDLTARVLQNVTSHIGAQRTAPMPIPQVATA